MKAGKLNWQFSFALNGFLCGFRNKIFIASSVGNEKKMGDINESSSTMLRRKSDDIQFHPSEIKLSSLLIVCLGMKCNENVDKNDFFRFSFREIFKAHASQKISLKLRGNFNATSLVQLLEKILNFFYFIFHF